MNVYRVQHRVTMMGPYTYPNEEWTSEEWRDWEDVRWGMMEHHDDPGTHPCPITSMGHTVHTHERCGFDSLDALLEWFEGALEALEYLGYEVVELVVPDVDVIGPDEHGQVVYNVNSAVRVV